MHTAIPYMELRKLFDIYYYNRSILWGNCYPRPSIEILEKTWKLKEHHIKVGERGVQLELDLDVDYS